ncbi:hypothetical protein UVI_02047800 [Ustilaginoidea virens]|uniref:Protein-lysine N-methyltransferase EFM4 n=1 Tax=Ustilaginoidea virens TaxID=1159556 RepID=A0A1B5L1U6_USTVR|nr:hypothetical protein UVI_02047800 [Ustilaginoidea virens]
MTAPASPPTPSHAQRAHQPLPDTIPKPSSSIRSPIPPPSPLTCSWNKLYTRELSNHASDPHDIGTVWFDDSDAEAKMVRFLDGLAGLPRSSASILDLGCGNGSMLLALRAGDWTGRALGADYSPQSVALARQVAAAEALGGGGDCPPLEFREWDIMSGPYAAVLDGAQESGWDVVLDKGTFDAVCLSGEKIQDRRLCELYCARVLPLVKKGGVLLVTSCNWTEDELTRWFQREGGGVDYPSFSFGGVKGQTISTLCFRKE